MLSNHLLIQLLSTVIWILFVRCFGDDVVLKTLRYRREFASSYLNTNHYLEQMHLVDLMTDTYEIGVQTQQLFLAHQREQIYPYFDEDILRVAFSINPDIRYIKGYRSKYLTQGNFGTKN